MNQKNAAHTPTPWNVRNDGKEYKGMTIAETAPGSGYYSSIFHTTQRETQPKLGGGISQETAEANAAFIVRACNAHADLVETGNAVHAALFDLMHAYSAVQEHYGLKSESSTILVAASEANKRLVAALEKAGAA